MKLRSADFDDDSARGSRLAPSRFRIGDVLAVAGNGFSTRKVRTALSALGITIGIAALVAILGLSESSRAELKAQIAALGTNLLTVEPGGGFGGGDGVLPAETVGKVARIGPVEQVADVISLDLAVLRNDYINENETGGLTALAADIDLLGTLNGDVAFGRWHDEASSAVPTVVLGSVSAERLGVVAVSQGMQILVGGEWFTVIGVLDPFPLAPDLDRSAIIGKPVAAAVFEIELNPSILYIRTTPDQLDSVRAVLPSTADPSSPEEVDVSRPSELLTAEDEIEDTTARLFLGLGVVALLVGGIGIANVMVIAVIERRNEIGLRRALGATRSHVSRQFLAESLLLSALGGLCGVALGAAVTAGYASSQGWAIVLPPSAMVGGFIAALVIGVAAGLYPAMRAARLAPTEALRAA